MKLNSSYFYGSFGCSRQTVSFVSRRSDTEFVGRASLSAVLLFYAFGNSVALSKSLSFGDLAPPNTHSDKDLHYLKSLNR